MDLSGTEIFDFGSAARRQRRVLLALMLRNIRTRFFGHGLGYLIAVAWPLLHILIIIALFVVAGLAPPYGSSMALFIATGALPFMVFSYLSRFMTIYVVHNRPLLSFPEVKVIDVLLASALLEILSALCVVFVCIVIGWFCGIDVTPNNVVEASYALGATVLLGFGFGLLNGAIALAFPIWATVYQLAIVFLWVPAGVFFVPDALPKPLRDILAYHPVLQVIEWMRSAYYQGYGDLVLDRQYVIEVGIGAVFLGLLLERGMRGHVLALR